MSKLQSTALPADEMKHQKDTLLTINANQPIIDLATITKKAEITSWQQNSVLIQGKSMFRLQQVPPSSLRPQPSPAHYTNHPAFPVTPKALVLFKNLLHQTSLIFSLPIQRVFHSLCLVQLPFNENTNLLMEVCLSGWLTAKLRLFSVCQMVSSKFSWCRVSRLERHVHASQLENTTGTFS